MNKKQIKKNYESLLQDVKTNDYYKIDLTNRVNCYVCSDCGKITKTKDVHAGCIPFMIGCEHCGEIAISTFHRDISPDTKPILEWYRPTLKELHKLSNGEIEHVLNGGLITRKIINK